jgi:hypothetical protein
VVVINVKQQVYLICVVPEDEYEHVRLGLNKHQGGDVHCELVVPCPGCLLQPIQRLVEKADMIRLRWINKSSRLATVDNLREGVVQEHILHIKVMNGPGAADDQGEHYADHG